MQKYRRRERHDSDQIDNNSADSERNLNQLVLEGLSKMNASLAMIHSLTAMKHFDGSDPKVCRKWLKMSISVQNLQDKNMWQYYRKLLGILYQMLFKRPLVKVQVGVN